MDSHKINQLIELIYESAIKPSKWAGLLNALAEFVDQIENETGSSNLERDIFSTLPSMNELAQTEDNETTASISATLKLISNIDDNKLDALPQISQANDLLLGHFARAIKIAKKLVDIDEQHNIVLSLLDRMPIALILVDSHARIIETNALADEMLLAQDGLDEKNNVLDAGDDNNDRLFSLIEKMSIHDPSLTRGQSLSITNENTKNNIMLFIAPLRKLGSQQKATAAIFISHRKSQMLTLPKSFSDNYKLTNKEMSITEQLIRGLSINEISKDQSLSTHTVRSHVKSVMKKTATSRQAELVSLIYNGMSDFVNPLDESPIGQREGLLNKKTVSLQNLKVIQLKDGRNIAYTEYGDLNGEPVFHFHSVLGSRLELAFDAENISQEKSIRLIIMDRPGYGASDSKFVIGYTHWVDDIVQLADHLQIEKFSITGYAMGGQYALACAHEIPERLKYVAIISTGLAPQSKSDYKNIIPLYKMSNRLAKYTPKLYKLMMSIAVKGVSTDPSSFFDQFHNYLGAEDQKIMSSIEFKSKIYASLMEGIKQGGKSNPHEAVMLMDDWGFKLENINMPINIWHGTSDYHVPAVLGQRFAEHIKKTKLFIKEGQGHYMFYTHWAEILDELLKNKM